MAEQTAEEIVETPDPVVLRGTTEGLEAVFEPGINPGERLAALRGRKESSQGDADVFQTDIYIYIYMCVWPNPEIVCQDLGRLNLP